jgi:hypothetical protein
MAAMFKRLLSSSGLWSLPAHRSASDKAWPLFENAVGDASSGGTINDVHALYRKLQKRVLSLCCEYQQGWIATMDDSFSQSASFFNSHRLMRRYATEADIR